MNREQAITMLGYFIGLIGNGYHPDTHMSDYTNSSSGAICNSFTDEHADELQALHDQMMSVLGDEAYTYGCWLVENVV